MSKHIAKMPVWIGIVLCVLFLYAIAALAEEPPISVRAAEPSPKTLTGPGTVQVNISISNSSDSSMPVNVTLFDPNQNVCTSFGSGGTASLPQGQADTYSGSWSVTQKELDAGKIVYTARYSFQNESGVPYNGTRPITIPIKQNTAVANMSVDRVPPTPTNGAVVQGQTVVLAYQIKNTGTIDLTDITIKDPGITSETVTYPLLKPGETKELSYSYVAGAAAKTSEATVTYKYEQGGKALSKTATGQPVVFNVTVPELVVTLKADTLMVNPGTKVTLTYTILNKGSLKYEQIKITDPLINDVESGLSLDGGKEITKTREVTVNATGTYQFTVTGTSSAGPITVISEPVTIQTIAEGTALETAAAVPVEMEIYAEADRDIIYEEPQDVVFHVVVKNTGTTAIKNINIYERKKLVKTIPTIEPGETAEFTKRFTVSSGGLYQFVAVAKDNLNKDQQVESDKVAITYKPLPVPTIRPTPVPDPTVAPVTTDDPMASQPNGGASDTGLPNESGGMGTALLYVLMVLLVIVLLSVGVLVILERRRSSPQTSLGLSGQSGAIVIDTIQRSPHRDYARAPKRSAQKRDAATGNDARDESKIAEAVPQKVEKPKQTQEEVPKRPQRAAAEKDKDPTDDKQRESVFKRPSPQSSDEKEETQELDSEDDTIMTDETQDKRDYLGSIRKGRREEVKIEASGTQKKTLSNEEAALLSGSTGQYRLSRGVQSPLQSSQSKAQDAQTFARTQRVSRVQKPDVSSYYDDDDDMVSEVGSRKRRK